jgi:hypothetical protein
VQQLLSKAEKRRVDGWRKRRAYQRKEVERRERDVGERREANGMSMDDDEGY